jgi:DNA-binding transcriptional ArsR family regulator
MEQLPSTATADIETKTVDVVPCGLGLRFCVDVASGEILNPTEQMLEKPAALTKRDLTDAPYVGLDTPWVNDARDDEELWRAVQTFDWWIDRLVYDADKILSLLDTGLSDKAVRVFKHLACGLSARNIWFGSIAELSEALGTPQRNVERALADLERHRLIERKHQGRYWPMKISLHPWYAWKGDLQARDQALQQWVLRTAKNGGRSWLQAAGINGVEKPPVI